MKQKIFWAILVLIVCVISVGALEFFLQVREYRRNMALLDRNDVFELSPYLQIRPKYNPAYHINKDHFRGDPVDESSDTYLIFTLGGSTTLSEPLSYEETYPARLEAKLKAKYPKTKIQVQNAACDWYSTQHSIIRYLFKIRHFQPDLIMVKHGINDLFRSFVPEAWSRPGEVFQPNYSHYLGAVVNFDREADDYFPFTKFLLWEKISGRLFQGRPKPWDLNPAMLKFVEEVKEETHPAKIREFRSLRIFEENMKILVDLVRMNATDIILSTQPSLYREGLSQEELDTLYFGPVHMTENGRYPDVASLEYGMRLFNDTVIHVGKERGVPVAEVDRSVPKSGVYFFDDIHPTAAAAEIEAELLAKKITELKLIENWKAGVKKHAPAYPPLSKL